MAPRTPRAPQTPGTPALAQCWICRATTKILDESRPLPEGWLYRMITVDVGRYYCPRHAHKA
ncbi:hypothetical protein E8P82_11680 [Arthrobacter echini]|uniref:Uncharacterized protein n=1 Tax=Arthrobacter echini TaxID=1529066 RepID=A0A4S5E2K5_9MICC|nr:hypothetical protein [Arthrobacter echini]THJ65625.1 hypothetical protein E8P82_11680 [Arthrobacter echini]